MFRTAETLLQLVYEALYAPYGTGYNYNGVNWEILYRMASGSKLLTLTCETIKRLANEFPISEEVQEKWKKSALENVAYSLDCQKAFTEFSKKAEKENIPYAIFKGFILADLYPKILYRTSNDTDIFVKMEDGPIVTKFLETLGYEKNLHDSTSLVLVYHRKEPFHRIEMHYSLWEEFKGPKIKILNNFHITDENHFISLNTCNMKLTTLGYEEHLIYQIFHTIKHILVEGMGFSSMVDITLYINRYGNQINYDSLWSKLEQLGYATFCETFFQCCIYYLKMDRSIMEHRPLPTSEMKGSLMIEFIRKLVSPYVIEHAIKMYRLTTPYVDGMDAYDDPESHLAEEEYSDVLERAKEKIKTIHLLGLSCQETTTTAIKKVEPVFTENLAESKKNAKFFYRIYGIIVASDIEMSELIPADMTTIKPENADVYVHYCNSPGLLDNPQLQVVQPTRIWFESTHGRFLAQNANEIVADKKDESYPDEIIKPYIISHGLAFILYMKNIITLHGATVGNEQSAITVIGGCGAGKSTISMELRKHGYKLIADDVSAIQMNEQVPYVQLAIPHQKFCRDTAVKEGYNPDELECISKLRDKYRLILPLNEMCASPRELKGIFEIIPDTKNNAFRVEKIEGLDAIRLLTANMFSQYLFTNTTGLSVDMFQNTLQIAKTVPIYKIYRPLDQDTISLIIDAIIEKSS